MAFGKLLKGVAKIGRQVAKAGNVPIVGNVLKAVPGVGTAISLAGAGYTAYDLMKGGGGGGGLPAIPGTNIPMMPGGIVGDRGILRNDPNIPDALKPYAISMANLRTVYRSPIKGFVVIRDQKGDPFALPKKYARDFGWRPSKKPPISVGDWEAVKRADRTIRKVKQITTTMVRVDKNIKGGKIVARKAKACK